MSVDPFTDTVMFTEVRTVTAVVLIVKFAVVAPAGTVTVVGGVACALFDVIWIT